MPDFSVHSLPYPGRQTCRGEIGLTTAKAITKGVHIYESYSDYQCGDACAIKLTHNFVRHTAARTQTEFFPSREQRKEDNERVEISSNLPAIYTRTNRFLSKI
jgi:hypothetical protein